ncbi:MAG: phosphatase PAP2 family protein [Bacteroidetes bacterium]|nr:phosphatase PAP2 family protein [Bacteroidota bacterium]
MLKIKRPDKTLFKGLKLTLAFWIIILVVLFVFTLFFFKGYLNVFFSENYSENFGTFFKFLTFFGEEWILIPICFIISVYFKDKIFALRAALAFIINTLITSISKYLVFDSVRPSLYLSKYNLIYTQGVELHKYNSFPSGHTSSAFVVAFILSFYFKNETKGLFFVSMAFLVALSRIYLQQHFAEDIIAGSIIGFFSAVLANSILIVKK